MEDVELTLVATDAAIEDWWTIERKHHDGREWDEPDEDGAHAMSSARISDADVEGHGSQMLRIAEAIEERGAYAAKRCAVSVIGDVVHFWSPRNSRVDGVTSYRCALVLAKEIREKIKP